MKEAIRNFSKANIKRYGRAAFVAATITLASYASGDNTNIETQSIIPENPNQKPIADIILPGYEEYRLEDLAPPEENAQAPEFLVTETPTPIQNSEPNRKNCQAIQGTDYLSGIERDFYLQNCIKIETPTVTPRPKTQNQPQTGNPTASAGQFTISGYYCKRTVGYPGFDSGGYCSEGASGLGTISGRTAACGPIWPFGTVFYIEGYGNVTCTDRGGTVGNSHIDIYFDTDHELHNAKLPNRANISIAK